MGAINSQFFKGNRQKLLASLPTSSVVVLTAHTVMQLTADMAAPFRQESNFWYLTGVSEPDWAVVITREKTWLVQPRISEIQRIFDGGMTAQQAKLLSGADEVVSHHEFKEIIDWFGSDKLVGTILPPPIKRHFSFTVNPAAKNLQRRLSRYGRRMFDVSLQLSQLRAIKQPVEIEKIESVIATTADAFELVKKGLTDSAYQFEYEVEADFTAHFRRQDMNHAYEPIIAAGQNACTLHYVANSGALENGQMLLMDVGAYDGGYAADITRTIAVGGQIDQFGRDLHQALQDAQREIINLIQPGIKLRDYGQRSDEIMQRTIKSLGLSHSETAWRRYFPHAVSHGLGIDVHESLGGYDEFKPGMLLTVEPGVYVSERSIGVRLEDDILVTETGNRNLSSALSLDMI